MKNVTEQERTEMSRGRGLYLTTDKINLTEEINMDTSLHSMQSQAPNLI